MHIQRATEDYLEAMLMMEEENGFIRSVDVAAQLNVTKPSVSYATKKLRESGYISMDKSGRITLNSEGRRIAENMLKRHCALSDLLIKIGVNPETAVRDACKMEHDISDESFTALCKLSRSIERK